MNSSVNYVDVELILASQNPKKRAGRKIFKETRHPVYRGIRSRNCGKWVCEIREPVSQKRIWLGSYPKPEMAARAHDVAVLAMRGRSACLNFADSVWRLPVPESSSVKDIQKAAKQAAEAFRYIEQEDIVEIATSEEDIAETTTSEEDIVETSSEEDIVETTTSEDEVSLYVDEEEMFGTPGFIASMAEGLMVPPPPWTMGFWKALIHQFFKA